MPQEGILELPGLGPTLLKRLEHQLGGRQAVVDALERGDVVALSAVNGVSRKRAVTLVQAHRGEDTDWVRTEDAEGLTHQAMAPFLDRAVTRMARGKLETLAPTSDRERLETNLAQARAWFDRLEEVELAPVRQALAHVAHPKEPRPQPEHDVTILADEGELHDRLQEEGLDRWVDITTGQEMPAGDTLVLAATLGETPRGSIYVPPGEPWEVVPWRDLSWAETNRELLSSLSKLSELLEVGQDHAAPVLEALDAEIPDRDVDLLEAAQTCLEEANEEIEQELEAVTLSGKDVLEVLQRGSARQVEEVVGQVASEARKRFQEATGVSGDPFTQSFPLKVDPGELARLERQVRADRALDRFRAAVDVARAVQEHREGLQAMVSAAIELDRWQATWSAAHDLGLSLPTLGDQLVVEGALHLSLAGEGDPVDYPVANDVTLLTGANSGGKTTLLETLGQIAYLAHIGLPVPAAHATVPVLDGLAYYARPRQLGAGAFEGFLRTIEPVLLADDEVLVLADELEAMTELEAASAIIAEIVTRLQDRGCPAVLVTHLAPFILEHVEAEVAGIEARGLDEEDELIVDRTPKLGIVARSTPELILQRLRNRAEDERALLYQDMLARLQG